MHMKNLVSAATLAVALGFTGTAFGQAVTLGTQTVSEADMERVKVHCLDLQNEANAANPGSTDTEDDTDGSTDAGTGTDGDTGTDDSTGTDTEGDTEQSTEEGTAGLIELDTVTLEQCIEAGLVE